MQKIHLKKIHLILISAILIMIAIGVSQSGVSNFGNMNLKSQSLDDCSAEQSTVDNIKQQIADEIEKGRSVSGGQADIQRQITELEPEGEALNTRKKDIEDQWNEFDKLPEEDKTDEARNNINTASFNYNTDVGFYNDKMTALKNDNAYYAAQGQFIDDVIQDLNDDLNKAEKALEDCRNKDDTCTNGASNYPDCNDSTCTNGATNPPSCDNNTCTNGATNPPDCNNNSCTNGATNPPSCDNNICTNGATNPPSCDNNTCTNGATNYPECSGYCGDGTVDSGEECDGGNDCDSSCHSISHVCGDNTLDSGEECDDGNTQNDDGCSATCTTETSSYCGNGTVESGEECDDGNKSEDDSCANDCTEQCDGGSDDEDYGMGSSFFGLESSWFKKKECVPGCKYNKEGVSNFNPQANKDDKSCSCYNKLDFYDSTHKHSKSCQCDLKYEPKDGTCVRAECPNGLNKDNYPDCKCKFNEIVVNGECVLPSFPKALCAEIINCAASPFTFGALSVDPAGRLRIPFVR